MNHPQQNGLRDALERIAGHAVPAGDPVPSVVRRAGRMKSRRTVAAAVAGATTVAMLVPVGLAVYPLGGHPASSPPGLEVPVGGQPGQGPLERSIDFDELGVGALPDVPWYADGAIHQGDRTVPFDVPGSGELGWLLETEQGYLAVVGEHVDGQRRSSLVLVDAGGGRQVLAEAEYVLDPLLSADGTTIAWTEHDGVSEGDEFAITVVVADAATGEIRSRSRLDPSDGYYQADAFLGDDLVLGGNGARDGAGLLDPRTGEVDPWLGRTGVLAVSPGGELAAAHSPVDGDTCATVIEISTDRPLWGECSYLPVGGFAPDGGSLVVLDGDAGPVEPSDPPTPAATSAAGAEHTGSEPSERDRYLVVVDARSGAERLGLDTEYPDGVTWESADTMIFGAWDGNRNALVRCSTGGECELATRPRTSDREGPAPYILGTGR